MFSAGQRHRRAKVLLQEVVQRDCVLTLQALAEFFAVATRKLKMPLPEARAQIEDWQSLFDTVLPETGTVTRAIEGVERHRLSFWDAMLWATAKAAGVTMIITEDSQHGMLVEGVKYENPFALPADDGGNNP